MSEFKPCPFCGGEPTIKEESLSEVHAYANRVTITCCSSVQAEGDQSKGGYADNSTTRSRAVSAWNTRTITRADIPEAIVDELKRKWENDLLEKLEGRSCQSLVESLLERNMGG